jgi:hypothetical protein
LWAWGGCAEGYGAVEKRELGTSKESRESSMAQHFHTPCQDDGGLRGKGIPSGAPPVPWCHKLQAEATRHVRGGMVTTTTKVTSARSNTTKKIRRSCTPGSRDG